MENLYDVIIVGGGPAGLTAALYLARAKYRVLVLEKAQFGGQIAITHEVVNYPGIARTSGKALTDTIRQQAENFGAEFQLAEATGFTLAGDVKTVHTPQGEYRCFGILLATGAHPRTIGFLGEEEHKGRGVAYCATCDGEFFTGKEIFVVGGGYAAAEESVFLTKFARHVTVLVRKDDFSCAASVAEQAKNHEKITVLYHTVMEEVSGENGLNYARYKNTATGEVTEYKSEEGFGVFVFAGYAPATEAVKGMVELDTQGYIVTDASLKTSVEGVYAAGDVCIKPLRQVVTATGDGALAATELEKYVAAKHRKTGLRADAPVRKQNKTAVTVDMQDSAKSDEAKNKKYANMYPFGMIDDSFAVDYHSNHLAMAFHYIYDFYYAHDNTLPYSLPSFESLLEKWKPVSTANKWSNLYLADSVEFKLRSIGLDEEKAKFATFSEKQIEQMAYTEHHRWNMEKLLMGYRALGKNEQGKTLDKETLGKLKNNMYVHNLIKPYADLTDGEKQLDRNIVSKLPDILRMLNY